MVPLRWEDALPLLRGLAGKALPPEAYEEILAHACGDPALVFDLGAEKLEAQNPGVAERARNIGLYLRVAALAGDPCAVLVQDLLAGVASEGECEIVLATALRGLPPQRLEAPSSVVRRLVAGGAIETPAGLRQEAMRRALEACARRLQDLSWARIEELNALTEQKIEERLLVGLLARRAGVAH